MLEQNTLDFEIMKNMINLFYFVLIYGKYSISHLLNFKMYRYIYVYTYIQIYIFPSLFPLSHNKEPVPLACLNLHEEGFENVHIVSYVISSISETASSKTETFQPLRILYIFLQLYIYIIYTLYDNVSTLSLFSNYAYGNMSTLFLFTIYYYCHRFSRYNLATPGV